MGTSTRDELGRLYRKKIYWRVRESLGTENDTEIKNYTK